MLANSIDMRRFWIIVLAIYGIFSASTATAQTFKGATSKADDLKVTDLKMPGQAILPCMLWVDEAGSAFLALEGGTGVVRRISFPDFKVTKQKDFERKFTWMSLSAEGALLSESDSEEIWVIDPATLEVKTKIAVPKLKRAVSAPGLTLAIACDRGQPLRDQKLYVVDLLKKKAEPWAVPMDMARKIGLDNPAIMPDGYNVFANGDLFSVHMCRFSFKSGKLEFRAAEPGHDDLRFHMGDHTPDNSAGITFSQDSKLVCEVYPQKPTTTIYPVDTFTKQECILEHGLQRRYLGYRALEPRLAMGFDVKGGYIYTQNGGQEFTIFTLTGVKKKEYKLGFGSVKQFLVHPGGNQVVLLRGTAIDSGKGRIVYTDSLLVETPRKK